MKLSSQGASRAHSSLVCSSVVFEGNSTNLMPGAKSPNRSSRPGSNAKRRLETKLGCSRAWRHSELKLSRVCSTFKRSTAYSPTTRIKTVGSLWNICSTIFCFGSFFFYLGTVSSLTLLVFNAPWNFCRTGKKFIFGLNTSGLRAFMYFTVASKFKPSYFMM